MNRAYLDLQDQLHAYGFATRFQSDHFGCDLVVELETPSHLAIGEDLNSEAGWSAKYTKLQGADIVSVYKDPRYDVAAMAGAVMSFVADRNRDRLADELARAIEIKGRVCQPYAGAWPLLRSGEPGTWVMVAADWPGDDTHLVVASYPQPDRGVTTDGSLVTGWNVTVQGVTQTLPYRVLYDAPDNRDTRPMVSAVLDWLVGAPVPH